MFSILSASQAYRQWKFHLQYRPEKKKKVFDSAYTLSLNLHISVPFEAPYVLGFSHLLWHDHFKSTRCVRQTAGLLAESVVIK